MTRKRERGKDDKQAEDKESKSKGKRGIYERIIWYFLSACGRLSKGQKLSNAILIDANTAFAYAVRKHREIDGTSCLLA